MDAIVMYATEDMASAASRSLLSASLEHSETRQAISERSPARELLHNGQTRDSYSIQQAAMNTPDVKRTDLQPSTREFLNESRLNQLFLEAQLTPTWHLLQHDDSFRQAVEESETVLDAIALFRQIGTFPRFHLGGTSETVDGATPPTATSTKVPSWLAVGLAELAIEIAAHIVEKADRKWDTPSQRWAAIFVLGWGIGYPLSQSPAGVWLFEYPGFTYSLLGLAARCAGFFDD